MTQFGPKLAFLSITGSFSALLVGWLVVVARGLYLAKHPFRPHRSIQWHKMAKKTVAWLSGPQIASNASPITQEVINWCFE